MKKSELLQRIVELERRIAALESRPVGPVYVPVPSPSVPKPWENPFIWQIPPVTCDPPYDYKKTWGGSGVLLCGGMKTPACAANPVTYNISVM
jgi:hypothetical protein